MEKRSLILTGSTGTLGKKFIELYSDKYNIFGIARRKVSPAIPNLCVNISNYGVDPDTYHIIFEKVYEQFGTYPDILINAASTSIWKPIKDITLSDIRHVFESNVTSNLFLTREFLLFKSDEIGMKDVVNIGSIASHQVYSGGQSIYAAAKSAQNILTEHFSAEFPYHKINSICPNSFPSIVSTEFVCHQINSIIESNYRGQTLFIENENTIWT